MPNQLSSVDLDPSSIDLVNGELSRRSLKEFIKLMWGVVEPVAPFVDGWHIDAFCDHLTHIRDIRNLLINVPPGHCKSLIFSVFFPCWQWIHDPSSRFLYASYALNLAERDSIKCRRLIASPLYQKCFGSLYQVRGDVDTKRQFENDKTGYRQAISVGSVAKGLKGNFCVLDDPHNADEAQSEIKRRIAVDWFTDSFFDRLNDFHQDCRIVVGQRIARDDLSGFILENYRDTWTHINLPYEYKPTAYVSPIGWQDPRTEDGEPLWPKRFPESEIAQLKKKKRTFSAQWNQNPIDLENAPIRPEDFRYYEERTDSYRCGDSTIPKSNCWRLAAVDLAASQSSQADYTAIVIADIAPSGELILVHAIRDRIPGAKLMPRLNAIQDEYRPAYILIENAATQKLIIDQALRGEGLPVRAIKPEGDKETRSIPLQVRIEAHQVWFPKDKPWVALLERELTEFPNAAHDDLFDALSYLAIEANKRTRQRPRPEAEQAPEKTEAQRMHELLWKGVL